MDKQRDYARIVTFIYVLALLVTLAVVFLIGLPFARTSHTWISLGTLILAETFIYGIVVHYLSNGNRASRLIPGYLALGTIAGLYFIAVVIFIVVFSLAADVSTYSYSLLHVIALGVMGIAAGLVALYYRNAESDDEKIISQVQWVSAMRSELLSIKQQLEGCKHEAEYGLVKKIAELDEKVRFSDPASHPSLVMTEQNLLQQARQLASEVSTFVKASDKDSEAQASEKLRDQIRDIRNVISTRNQQLIQLK
ncbi:hypothetical protein [Cohnella abietis]|uniref:Uncharacterized protein n=1 Tax=Cohnella abietis TaxID=2507935 RepID=A0A3T1DFE2_9BACL|nr:hypothetical protein [Cohnella abietis]BBI36754.1 hypothetical protein KCTCHS21_61530 [Cohnella abietis]